MRRTKRFGWSVLVLALAATLPAVDLGTGRTATAISAGSNHTCAILDNGSLKCWGTNSYGQLGQGDTVQRGDGPGEMGDALPGISRGTGRRAAAVVAGSEHVCARLDDGAVKCWGVGFAGRLGQGNSTDRGDNPGEMGDALPPIDLGTAAPADTTDPTVAITTPPAGGAYFHTQVVNAAFSCSDTGSGIATCVGTVANGQPIDTATYGNKSFTVTATDLAGTTAPSGPSASACRARGLRAASPCATERRAAPTSPNA